MTTFFLGCTMHNSRRFPSKEENDQRSILGRLFEPIQLRFQEKTNELKIGKIHSLHPPNSQDSTPSYYFLFLNMKQ